jgi:hypothetical protein
MWNEVEVSQAERLRSRVAARAQLHTSLPQAAQLLQAKNLFA